MSDHNLEKAHLLSVLKHDMNNVLTGVKTGLEIMAMDDFFEDEDNAEDLNDVKKASVRMANMLEDLSLIFGDEPGARPPFSQVNVGDLCSRLREQLAMEHLELLVEGAESAGSEFETQPESLVRGLFYGGLLLNEIEKGAVNLSVDSSGKTWSFSLSSTRGQELSELIENRPEGRSAFLLKIAELAASRLGGAWELSTTSWSLTLEAAS